MKILSAVFVLMFSVSLGTAQVINGDFELWNQDTLFQDPDGYVTTNFQAYVFLEETNVEQVVESGDTAVRLHTIIDGTDTLIGLVNSQEPYTATPTAVTIRLSWDVKAGDTAGVAVMFTGGTLPFPNFAIIQVTGSSPMLDSTVLLAPFLGVPDSVTVFALSSTFTTPKDSSEITLSNIIITGGPQIGNHHFNDWTSIESNEPEGWFTPNLFQAINGAAPVATQDTDVHGGQSSIRIVTSEVSFGGGSPDTIGFISNGELGPNGPAGGEGLIAPALRIEGYYKYFPVGNDTAVAYLAFFSDDTLVNQSDTLIEVELKLPANSSYAKFELNFDIDTVPMPDSFMLAFASSNLLSDSAAPQLGSTLLLDDIVMIFTTGLTEWSLPIHMKAYPNPAKESLTLELEKQANYLISIADIQGRLWHVEHASADIYTIETSHLPAGNYVVTVREGRQTKSLQFIKN